MNFSEKDLEDIAEAVANGLEQRRRISVDIHDDHHQFVATLIKEREERRQLWIEMRIHLAKWGMVGVLTGVVTALWYWLKHNVHT